MSLQFLAVPLGLGSLWAYGPALVAAVLCLLRTTDEDRMLLAELPGYQHYANQVRYRLLPRIW
jgi:protein-S-isoprenylcysteine O-methyltransferase Ste14